MWKAKSIIGKWQFIYHTNNALYRGFYILPSLKIFYHKGKTKYSYYHSIGISLNWLFFGFAINRLSQ